MAKDAPNPNAQPEDPSTDPAAAAKRDNDMEKASAAKTVAADANAAKAKKAALAQVRGDVDPEVAAAIAATKIESVKGPPAAPIGYGVHALSIEGGNPYAAKQMYRAAEPAMGIQHQPVMLPADYYRGEQPKPAPLSPEMQYRRDVGETGVKAADASYKDLVAAGMTDTPKVRYNNSITAEAPKAEGAPEAAPKGEVNAATDKTVASLEKAAEAPKAEAKAAPEAPKAAALMQKQDTIGEPKYDWDVYRFSHSAIYDPLEA